jgi:hypothetical protein
MEIELSYDIPELVIGQLSALKKLGHSNRKVAELITSWRYPISHTSVGTHWK